VYAWLEEISFRSGVTALIVVAAVVVGGTIAAIDLAEFGGPAAVRHTPAAQALPATPQTASTAPASGPETALPRLRHDPGPPRHTAVPVAAAVPAAAQAPPSAPPASPPRPSHHHRRGFPVRSRPGHGHGRPQGDQQGRPRGDEQGRPREDGHGWHGQGPDGRHRGSRDHGRHGRHAGHAAGRHERHPGDEDARHHAGRTDRDPHDRQAGQIARQQ